MTSSGIRRKVDDLGRVVIPAGMRRTLGIREGDAIEVSVEGERVVLAKPRDACVFCGREEKELTGFRGRLVCRDCLAALGSVDERLRATASAQPPPPSTTPRTVAQLPDWDAPGRAGAGDPASDHPAPGAPGSRPGPRPRVEPPTGPGPERADVEVAEHDRSPASHRHEGSERDAEDERGGGDEDSDPRRRRRPPYDPASTTAW